MIILEWIVEILFFACCGWLGHVFVKAITLGKVDLEYGESSEGVVAELIGVAMVLAIAIGVSLAINYATG